MYKYFKDENLRRQFPNALKLIEQERLAIDVLHLNLLECAENKETMAVVESFIAFSNGKVKGIPYNEKLARYFGYIAISLAKEKYSIRAKVEVLKNVGIFEINVQNIEAGKKLLIEAMKIMCAEVAPELWDYQLIGVLHVLNPDDKAEQ